LTKNYSSFYPKNCHQALKNLSLGSRGQIGIGSRIRIRNTGFPQHCLFLGYLVVHMKNTWRGKDVRWFETEDVVCSVTSVQVWVTWLTTLFRKVWGSIVSIYGLRVYYSKAILCTPLLSLTTYPPPPSLFFVFGKIIIGVSQLEMKPNAENSVFLFFEEKYRE
jgi:hypothetical protein